MEREHKLRGCLGMSQNSDLGVRLFGECGDDPMVGKEGVGLGVGFRNREGALGTKARGGTSRV